MPSYKVIVEFSGSKEYIIEAESPDAVYALLDEYASFDNYTNPTCDRLDEEIFSIEPMNP